MQVSIEIKGLDRFISAMKSADRPISKSINEAIKKSIFDLRANTIPITPIDTGRLRGSFDQTFTNLEGRLFPTVDYAIYLETGTRKMRAQPYMKPGVDRTKNQIEQNFKYEMDKAMEEIARKV